MSDELEKVEVVEVVESKDDSLAEIPGEIQFNVYSVTVIESCDNRRNG